MTTKEFPKEFYEAPPKVEAPQKPYKQVDLTEWGVKLKAQNKILRAKLEALNPFN